MLLTGHTFSDTPPDNLLTAAALNGAINDATLLPRAITAHAEKAEPADADLLLIVDSVDGALKRARRDAIAQPVRASLALSQLRVMNHPVNPATILDIAAEEIALRNPAGQIHVCDGVTATANITINGAGGLDIGSPVNNTWYTLWLISDGTNAAGLLSTSATAPTMPGGYTYKRLIGVVQRAADGSLRRMVQRGGAVHLAPLVLRDGTATVGVEEAMPLPFPAALLARIAMIHGMIGSTGGGVALSIATRSAGSIRASYAAAAGAVSAPGGYRVALPFSIIPEEAAVHLVHGLGANVKAELTGFHLAL